MSESFNWNLPGLSRTQFHAFTNLLSLRNGGQVEPATLPEGVLEEDYNDDRNAAGVDTRNAHQISDSGHNRLKREFLDCLAEFAANKKSGKTVACTAMKEAEDNVKFWIARNEGFPDQEKLLFSQLSELLSSLSYSKDNKTIEDSLWNEMLSYHQDRIQTSYIPSLRASFKDYNAIDNNGTIKNLSALDAELLVLQNLVFDVTKPGQSAINKHNQIVTAAYEVQMIRSLEKAPQSSSGAATKTKKLWADICLLARLRTAFQKFKEVALTLPSFNKVTITLLPRASTSVNQPKSSLSLKQTFDILELNLNPPTAKGVLGQKWTIGRAEQEFTKRQKQKLNIHAEVQMLLFLSSSEPSFRGVLSYFGCSVLSCFMCAHFLRLHGRFATRGCHGRLLNPWTVPETAGLYLGQADEMAQALIQLQKDLKDKLKFWTKRDIRQEKTSVTGGSSILSDYKAEGSQQQFYLEQQKMKAEQERVAEMFKRQSFEQSRSDFQRPAMMTSSKETDIISGGLDDLLPGDEGVLEDFGFNRLTSWTDHSKLMGLYQGLYRYRKVAVEDVHQWQVEGTLVANIKKVFYQIPERQRGGYFPWFLKHTHILERRATGDGVLSRALTKQRGVSLRESKVLKPQALKLLNTFLISIMTAVALPSGSIVQWCIGSLNFSSCVDSAPFNKTTASDYITICCDGGIIDTTQNIWQRAVAHDNFTLDLDNLECCEGDGFGGMDSTTCNTGLAPTPLASLAGTNTQNAQLWTDSSFAFTHTPYCAWLQVTSSALWTATVSTLAVQPTLSHQSYGSQGIANSELVSVSITATSTTAAPSAAQSPTTLSTNPEASHVGSTSSSPQPTGVGTQSKVVWKPSALFIFALLTAIL
ncbi:hypothetical protein AOQ84DRAFT_420660 [Glonium stellatum]|uniref:Uncharacterized protein n=1 Tax=Glonium stellatum TaxID=574774 RepID=A0A8E2JMX9_9PEZI|nr:hypothetical protein AOQ84DRAFT_420660 [Glonium stellatum]